MNIENFKAPVGAAIIISIICILLDYKVIGVGVYSLLTFIPVIGTALLILFLAGMAFYNYFTKD